ncbi:MAG: FMN-binding negative transcriptional regulator [Paraglaciecola sp.]|uniref:FMN-binding negative transcriptional regulator n=1 Tax=Paraglaciecola sp. TaxID=1920173 RepID=UPI0032987310
MNQLFKAPSPKAIVDLIKSYPLAWVLSIETGAFFATPLPLLADTDENGQLIRLVGHLALHNPHVSTLKKQPKVHILFMGPQGYISPSWQDNPTWAPTWNYAVLKIEAELQLRPDQNDAVLTRTVDLMESAHSGTWSIADMGERYTRLNQGIIAFHAKVTSITDCFKMGQDESPETMTQLLSQVDQSSLGKYMRDYYPENSSVDDKG